jgi:hypothetical protein
MAHIIRQTVDDNLGKEAGLAVIGRAFLVSGILATLGGIAFAIWMGEFVWIFGGLACLVVGVAFHVAFGALSEIIILLKRLCGLPCSGVISGTGSGEIFICSGCGTMVYASSEKCLKCGETLYADEE